MTTRSLAALSVLLLAVSLASPVPPLGSLRAHGQATTLAASCDGGDGLYLYADRDYAGACFKITEDAPRLGDLGFNDLTSSIRFVGSFAGGHRTAELYVDGNYGGDIQIVSSDVPWMGDTVVGNDRLSSVRLGFRCAGVSEIPQAECQALVDLYNQTNGAGWENHEGWLRTNAPCSWWGLQCSAGHVSDLDLYQNQLSGSIPNSIGNLSDVLRVVLDANQLGGNIPASLGDLTRLWALSLGSNQLSGSIPSTLGNLANLVYLTLDHNQLGESIPAELGNLGKLQEMHLNNNLLTGGIPASLGSLSALTWLNLHTNGLTGNIPSTFRYLSGLGGLLVHNNPLGGELPLTLMEIPLQTLHFENTGLCEPPDPAFQAWLAGLLECGRTGVLCSEPSPTPTATGIAAASPTPTGTTVAGATPTRTATPTKGVVRRVYLPVVLRGYSRWTDDEFNGPSLDPRWWWVNEDPAGWSLTERPGYLRIRTHSGSTGDKNLVLRLPPPGDWGVRTHVSFAPVSNFQSAGIVVWGGPGNFLRLARAFCDLASPNCVGDGIYFDRFEGGVWVGSNYAIPWPAGSPVHLWLERVGQNYHGYCSFDGLSWIWLGSHSAGFSVAGVGLTSSQGSASSPNSADFDWFRVSPVQ